MVEAGTFDTLPDIADEPPERLTVPPKPGPTVNVLARNFLVSSTLGCVVGGGGFNPFAPSKSIISSSRSRSDMGGILPT
jgi:hypothetical protein